MARLSAVRGVGRWTAEMFLMFRLSRSDILALGDYGLRRGYAVAAVPDGGQLVPVAGRQGGAGAGPSPLARHARDGLAEGTGAAHSPKPRRAAVRRAAGASPRTWAGPARRTAWAVPGRGAADAGRRASPQPGGARSAGPAVSRCAEWLLALLPLAGIPVRVIADRGDLAGHHMGACTSAEGPGHGRRPLPRPGSRDLPRLPAVPERGPLHPGHHTDDREVARTRIATRSAGARCVGGPPALSPPGPRRGPADPHRNDRQQLAARPDSPGAARAASGRVGGFSAEGGAETRSPL